MEGIHLEEKEVEGTHFVKGEFVDAEDMQLGKIKLFVGAELAEAGYWQSFPRIYLAEDVLQHPTNGKLRLRGGAVPILTGGMGDRDARETLKRMEDTVEDLRSGKFKLNGLRLNGSESSSDFWLQ